MSLSKRIRGGLYPRCFGVRPEYPHQQQVAEGIILSDDRLPILSEIFLYDDLTRECLPASLIPLARAEYGKIFSRVIQHNCADAWDTSHDIEVKQRARRAWVEFSIFANEMRSPPIHPRAAPRAILPLHPVPFGSVAGRRPLWSLVGGAIGRYSARGSKTDWGPGLVSLGRVSETTNRIVSPGFASQTPVVKAKLLAKFPVRGEQVVGYDGLAAPPEIPIKIISTAINSIRRGSGPDPEGIRGDFLRDLL